MEKTFVLKSDTVRYYGINFAIITITIIIIIKLITFSGYECANESTGQTIHQKYA